MPLYSCRQQPLVGGCKIRSRGRRVGAVAVNAGIYAAEIVATFDARVAHLLAEYKGELARLVTEKNIRVKQQFAGKAS
jgi:phosphoribosylcarboxyaminoimidazole (NCAIR) mutase